MRENKHYDLRGRRGKDDGSGGSLVICEWPSTPAEKWMEGTTLKKNIIWNWNYLNLKNQEWGNHRIATFGNEWHFGHMWMTLNVRRETDGRDHFETTYNLELKLLKSENSGMSESWSVTFLNELHFGHLWKTINVSTEMDGRGHFETKYNFELKLLKSEKSGIRESWGCSIFLNNLSSVPSWTSYS